jgi:hypothetical protein
VNKPLRFDVLRYVVLLLLLLLLLPDVCCL